MNNSAYYDLDEHVDAISDSKELVDAVSNPKSNPRRDPKVDTHTNNRNFPQKFLRSRFVPKIIQGVIFRIDQLVTEDVPEI